MLIWYVHNYLVWEIHHRPSNTCIYSNVLSSYGHMEIGFPTACLCHAWAWHRKNTWQLLATGTFLLSPFKKPNLSMLSWWVDVEQVIICYYQLVGTFDDLWLLIGSTSLLWWQSIIVNLCTSYLAIHILN